MLRFKVLGFPVAVQGFFWLTCVLLGGGFSARTPQDWVGVVIWTAVVFVSVMVHELGHALVGRRFGAHPAIVLHGMGGLTLLPGGRFTRWQGIQVSLAGPGAGLLLGLMVLLWAPLFPLDIVVAKQAVVWLLWVNLGWSVFNLLPILPMDGGQVLRQLVGPKREAWARGTGAVLALLLGLYLLSIQWWFAGILLGFMAYGNLRGTLQQGGVSREE